MLNNTCQLLLGKLECKLKQTPANDLSVVWFGTYIGKEIQSGLVWGTIVFFIFLATRGQIRPGPIA